MNDLIAKTSAEMKTMRKIPLQTAVKYAEVLKDKALRCVDAFSEQKTKSIFVEGLPLIVRDNMRMY